MPEGELIYSVEIISLWKIFFLSKTALLPLLGLAVLVFPVIATLFPIFNTKKRLYGKAAGIAAFVIGCVVHFGHAGTHALDIYLAQKEAENSDFQLVRGQYEGAETNEHTELAYGIRVAGQIYSAPGSTASFDANADVARRLKSGDVVSLAVTGNQFLKIVRTHSAGASE
ncbi:MAG: hypothetical protein AAF439_10510 [Pseudomonadota bacterium]